MNVGPPPISPTAPSQRQDGCTEPSGPTIPKPSVALCSANPTTSTVARPIAPARAETPIASPCEVVQPDRDRDDQARVQGTSPGERSLLAAAQVLLGRKRVG